MSELEGVRRVGVKDWGNHPLAHKDGIAVMSLMLALMMQTVTVICQGVDVGCGWRGRRKGGPFFAADKPCPRCGSSVEVSERSRARFLRLVTPEEKATLDKASAEYDARPA